MVVLVRAPHTACEELLDEGYAMFDFAVPGFQEVVNNVSELDVCARVKERCQGVRCLVWRGVAYLVLSFSLS